MKNAIKELKVWTVFMTAGVSVLATEVAVKTQVSSTWDAPVLAMGQPVPAAVMPLASSDAVTVDEDPLPEELVANLLVDSVVQIESAGNPRIVGRKGERGLMQIKKATWKETTVTVFGKALPFDQAFDPELNRQVGTAYLSYLHEFLLQHRSQWQADERSLLLACYNAGPNRVASSGFNLGRLPLSTQDYVKRATALHDDYLKRHEIKLVKDGRQRGRMQIIELGAGRGS